MPTKKHHNNLPGSNIKAITTFVGREAGTIRPHLFIQDQNLSMKQLVGGQITEFLNEQADHRTISKAVEEGIKNDFGSDIEFDNGKYIYKGPKSPVEITELRVLYLLGYNMSSPREIDDLFRGRRDCLLLDGNKQNLKRDDIAKILREKKLTIGANTRIEIVAHGGLRGTKHIINLNKNPYYTTDVLTGLSNLRQNKENLLFVNLWNCYAGTVETQDLPNNSIVIAHVESEHASIIENDRYKYVESLKEYLENEGKLSPYQQFLNYLPYNFATMTFLTKDKEGKATKFEIPGVLKEDIQELSKNLDSFSFRELIEHDREKATHDFCEMFPEETKNMEYKPLTQKQLNIAVIGRLMHAINSTKRATNSEEVEEIIKKVIEKLSQQKIDINTKIMSNTLLHIAAADWHTTTVELLIQKGADVNGADSVGATPLFLAAQDGHTAVVETLITAGANVNAKDDAGITPL